MLLLLLVPLLPVLEALLGHTYIAVVEETQLSLIFSQHLLMGSIPYRWADTVSFYIM